MSQTVSKTLSVNSLRCMHLPYCFYRCLSLLDIHFYDLLHSITFVSFCSSCIVAQAPLPTPRAPLVQGLLTTAPRLRPNCLQPLAPNTWKCCSFRSSWQLLLFTTTCQGQLPMILILIQALSKAALSTPKPRTCRRCRPPL
jgi:hypothetical protein